MLRFGSAVALLLVFGMATFPAHPCSAFAIPGADEVLLAKNFDWHFGTGYLVKNPVGVSRRALPLWGGEPAAWTASFGSLTFTQFGAGLPYGGINQRGLAIEMLWLDETVYPGAAERTIGELEWIQYQLDTRGTVAEVIANLSEFSIRPLGGKIHYILADESGDRALIEFLDGEARVHRGEAGPLICTNDTRTLSELAARALGTGPLEGTSSRVRYAKLRRDLDGLAAPPHVERAFGALESVSESGARYRTQWATVYELRKRRVHISPDKSSRRFVVDAAALDFAPGSGTTYQSLFDRKKDSAGFARLDANVQRALLRQNLPKVGVDSQLDAIADHLLDPASSAVRPLERATLRVRVKVGAPGAFARIAVFGNQREMTKRTAKHAGSVLLDATLREFAFYGLPPGRYAVGAYLDRNQNGRPDKDEPLAFHRADPASRGTRFDDIAFELKGDARVVELVLL